MRLFLIALLIAADASMAHAIETSSTSTTASRRLGPIELRPASPRLGDLLMIYVDSDDPNVLAGGARLFGREIELMRIDSRRLRGLAAVPIDLRPESHLIEIDLPNRALKAWVTVRDRPFEEDTLSVDPRFTKRPSPAIQRRLAQEQRQWSAVFRAPASRPRLQGKMQRPVDTIRTASFGTRRIFNGKTKSRHYGLDLEGQVGDPVRAIQAGRVVMSSMRWTSGGTIIIDHGNGLYSAYFHLSARAKSVGHWVQAGEQIGLVGQSGRVTGPHLHLSVLVRMVGRDRRGEPTYQGFYVEPEQVLALEFPADAAYLDRPKRPAKVRTSSAKP